MWNSSFELALGGCSVSKCCVSFSSFYVVSDEFSDGVRYTSMCELVVLCLYSVYIRVYIRVVMCGMLSVMYGRSVFSNVFG